MNDKLKLGILAISILVIAIGLQLFLGNDNEGALTEPANPSTNTIAPVLQADDSNFSQNSTIDRATLILSGSDWESVSAEVLTDEFYDIKSAELREELESLAERFVLADTSGNLRGNDGNGEFAYLVDDFLPANFNPTSLEASTLLSVAGVNWKEAITFETECFISGAFTHAEEFETAQEAVDLEEEQQRCTTIDWRQQNSFSVFVVYSAIRTDFEEELKTTVVNIVNTDEGLRVELF